MKAQPDITILPVFDQSVGNIWADFARVQKTCCFYDSYDIYESQKKKWELHDYNFAFAAYDGLKMVGFASGYMYDSDCMYLQDLYVEPEYQGMKIGSQLLKQSERAAAIVARSMSASTTEEPVADFYEKNGFTNYDCRNMLKYLPKKIIGVVPVFKPRALKPVSKVEFNKKIVKQCKHKPIFIYVNDKYEIDGIAVRTPDNEDKIWVNKDKVGMKDFYAKRLLKALSNVR